MSVDELQKQLDGIRDSVATLNIKVSALDRDFSEQRDEMKTIMHTLIGSLDKPGSLELLRRTHERQEEMCEKLDRFTGVVESLTSTKHYLFGYLAGAAALIAAIAWIITTIMKALK